MSEFLAWVAVAFLAAMVLTIIVGVTYLMVIFWTLIFSEVREFISGYRAGKK